MRSCDIPERGPGRRTSQSSVGSQRSSSRSDSNRRTPDQVSAAISVSSRLYRCGGGGTIRPDVVQPEVRYARTADGVNIAYQVRGEGPVDLVYTLGMAGHFEVELDARLGHS